MTCKHYEGEGAKKKYDIDDKLKCRLCSKQLTNLDINKIKEELGK